MVFFCFVFFEATNQIGFTSVRRSDDYAQASLFRMEIARLRVHCCVLRSVEEMHVGVLKRSMKAT